MQPAPHISTLYQDIFFRVLISIPQLFSEHDWKIVNVQSVSYCRAPHKNSMYLKLQKNEALAIDDNNSMYPKFKKMRLAIDYENSM